MFLDIFLLTTKNSEKQPKLCFFVGVETIQHRRRRRRGGSFRPQRFLPNHQDTGITSSGPGLLQEVAAGTLKRGLGQPLGQP